MVMWYRISIIFIILDKILALVNNNKEADKNLSKKLYPTTRIFPLLVDNVTASTAGNCRHDEH